MGVASTLERIEATVRKAHDAVDAAREPEPSRHSYYLPMGVRGGNRGHRRWTRVSVDR